MESFQADSPKEEEVNTVEADRAKKLALVIAGLVSLRDDIGMNTTLSKVTRDMWLSSIRQIEINARELKK